MKLVILDGGMVNPGDLSWETFSAFGALTVYDRTPPAQVLDRMRGAAIVLSNKVTMDDALFAQCPDLKLLAVLATGYNCFDVAAATRRGITVCNIPAYGGDAVAQHTFALLLEICAHSGDHNASVHRGDWVKAQDYCYWLTPLTELAGKTFGIIGLGNIGRKVADIAVAFGMQVLYNSRTRHSEAETKHIQYASLDDLLAQSDIVSLHCPLTPETTRLINARAIARMKGGAILLNTTRGAVLDERAVADALNSGTLAAAGIDVLSAEPPQMDNPLLLAKNCIVTPHIAWAPRETRARLMQIAYDNVKAFVAGAPQNVVTE